MRALARHWGLWLLLAAAAWPVLVFSRHTGIASMSDDSVSYLMLARWMEGTAGEAIGPWLPWHSHFAPLFPLVLAAAGGAQDFGRAHLVVALAALASLAAIYRFVWAATARRDAAVAVAALFALTPTAWISANGILSETLFLFVSMEALRLHVARVQAPAPRMRDIWLFGFALGAVYLTRTAGIALAVAYGMHALLRLRGERDARPWLAFIPMAAMALAWIALRPAGVGDGYAGTGRNVAQAWMSFPGVLAAQAPALLFGGWASSFTGVSSFAGDPAVPLAARVALGLVALFALAGAILRARANALDGWYVLATLAMLFAWVFDEENMRRLLYPIVPLTLFHAGVALAAACRRFRGPKRVPLALALGAAFMAALSVPPVAGIADKARDVSPLLEGHARSAADMTEYYRIANIPYAAGMAARHAAALTGFDMLPRLTPREARVMYARPEYVALLGGRRALALDYSWDSRRLAAEVQASGAEYLVATSLAKSDLRRARGDAMAAAQLAAPYTKRTFALQNLSGGDEFVLLEVDREALARFVGAKP